MTDPSTQRRGSGNPPESRGSDNPPPGADRTALANRAALRAFLAAVSVIATLVAVAHALDPQASALSRGMAAVLGVVTIVAVARSAAARRALGQADSDSPRAPLRPPVPRRRPA